jgi:hypothetical protein
VGSIKNAIMYKKIIATTIGLIVMLSLNGQPSKAIRDNHYPWFPFTWQGDFINGKWHGKTSIVLPFGASGGISKIHTIQLDTGCNGTFFTDEGYLKDNNLQKEDLKKILLAKINTTSIQSFFSEMDKTLRKQFSCDSLTTRKVVHHQIGVIGSDLFENKILLIDYPNSKLCILDSIDSNYRQKFTAVDMEIKYNLPLIPLKVGKRKHQLLFDTGSSDFDIHTSKKEWDSIVPIALPIDTMGPLNSWGTPIWFFGLQSKDACEIAGNKFPKCEIWYSDNKRLEDVYKTLNVFGLTGNSLYLDRVLMIDYKNKYFGIKNK